MSVDILRFDRSVSTRKGDERFTQAANGIPRTAFDSPCHHLIRELMHGCHCFEHTYRLATADSTIPCRTVVSQAPCNHIHLPSLPPELVGTQFCPPGSSRKRGFPANQFPCFPSSRERRCKSRQKKQIFSSFPLKKNASALSTARRQGAMDSLPLVTAVAARKPIPRGDTASPLPARTGRRPVATIGGLVATGRRLRTTGWRGGATTAAIDKPTPPFRATAGHTDTAETPRMVAIMLPAERNRLEI